mmetsp:Transcript_106215/g.298660  ORF Transcript_106215/g.298660 Transcript_106215/m.298660 type:complete len:384 (+) Transcript_106215:70-1221(+)
MLGCARRICAVQRDAAAQPSDWLIVGAGPCGIISAAVLARRGKQVAWVDSDFTAVGRLGRCYQKVPGNTKVGRLLEAFRDLPALRFAEGQARRRAEGIPILSEVDPEDTCELSLCVHALADGSSALLDTDGIHGVQGVVVGLDGGTNLPWKASVETPEGGVLSLSAKNVLLCTGGVPRMPPPTLRSEVEVLQHDDVVAPDTLADLVRRRPALLQMRWGIVGGSHSGMLAAMNLSEMGATDISVFCSRELRWAEPRDDGRWIKFDGSGLKGRVAAWARNLPESVRLRGRWSEDDAGALDVLVHCTGFSRAPVPPVAFDGTDTPVMERAYDRTCGAIDGLQRLYGAGLGFMQEYEDPEGHVETRVGFVPFFIEHVGRIADASEAT